MGLKKNRLKNIEVKELSLFSKMLVQEIIDLTKQLVGLKIQSALATTYMKIREINTNLQAVNQEYKSVMIEIVKAKANLEIQKIGRFRKYRQITYAEDKQRRTLELGEDYIGHKVVSIREKETKDGKYISVLIEFENSVYYILKIKHDSLVDVK